MKSDEHIAVIDVGKTNKKILIYDAGLNLLESEFRQFPEYEENGIHFEDVENAFSWCKEQLAWFAERYTIRSISIATHGATGVCIDKDGNCAVPPVAYTTDAGEDFRREFYEKFGDREALQEETATAEVGSLVNFAKLIYFVKKHWPERFEQTNTILCYPQYFGFRFTGKTGAEPTYLGCHTYLFDFHSNKYSSVAEKMGIADKLPQQISRTWEKLGTISPEIAEETGLPNDCVVTMGVHDSNASLLPYLVQGYKDFVLNSTGTWCVEMHPGAELKFQQNELGKLVFYNLDVFFNPAKTSIFMGGQEFDTYSSILEQIHGEKAEPAYSPERYEEIIRDKQLFILPSVVKGTGLFPDDRPRVVENGVEYPLEKIQSGEACPEFFKDYEKARAVLDLSLVIQTQVALSAVGFDGKGSIFTEGGFTNNEGYLALLSSMYPDADFALTELKEATAFGAALLGKAALENTTPMETAEYFDITTNRVSFDRVSGIEEYSKAFFEMLEG